MDMQISVTGVEVLEEPSHSDRYRYAGSYVFDGTNYVDTGIYLFEANTINRDFEISFEITEQSATQVKQATIICAMDESGSPWPRIVYRFTSDVKQHQIGANVNSSIKTEQN